jgi:hypothetical protein
VFFVLGPQAGEGESKLVSTANRKPVYKKRQPTPYLLLFVFSFSVSQYLTL